MVYFRFMSYFKKSIKGLTWMGALRLFLRSLTYLRLAILARVLDPGSFGVFGIASLVLAFLEIVTETGINVFLIQDEGKLNKYVNSAWVVSIIRGFLISLILTISAPLVSKFFNSPESKNLVYLISIIPLIRGFINPSIVKLQKNLEFNKEFFLRSGIFTFDSVVTIILAFIYKSASCFIFGMLASVLLELVVSHIFISPKPKLNFVSEQVKEIIKRGKWITVNGILSYLFTHVDDFIVGRILGTANLGYYQMSYKVSELPITEVSNVFHNVTFPIFVKIRNDKNRVKSAYLKTTLTISVLTILFGLIIFLFAKEFVSIILGKKWLPIVDTLKILTVAGVVRAIMGEAQAVFLAFKKQEYITYSTLAALLIIVVTIIPLISKFGIIGASISTLIAVLLTAPMIIFFVLKVFK